MNPKQAISIIDVHADEQLRDVDLTKSLTEETTVVMSHSKKRNKDLPSSQQKRKHQITYLAYKVIITSRLNNRSVDFIFVVANRE